MRNSLIIITVLVIITSCEKVVEIDLNKAENQLVIEAIISKDSVCILSLTKTSTYYSQIEPDYVEDAEVSVSDGASSELLSYTEKGIYRGNTVIGTPDKLYSISISLNGEEYAATSYLSASTVISNVDFSISEEQSQLNPFGDRVVSINCTFNDNINEDNYYLIRFSEEDGSLIERYYLLTESESNSGTLEYNNGIIRFSESIFYEGNYIEVQVFSVDENIYNYFLQLTDILFWKRRIMPPTPYNPESNLSNGALGYFAAWSFDSEILILE